MPCCRDAGKTALTAGRIGADAQAMHASPPGKPPPPAAESPPGDRAERQARALRDNLRRRKAQARARGDGVAPEQDVQAAGGEAPDGDR
jgi:hypothetical protein